MPVMHVEEASIIGNSGQEVYSIVLFTHLKNVGVLHCEVERSRTSVESLMLCIVW
jgi:hypothetical protein